MADYEGVDFFADASLIEDPYPYFEHLRAKCPITPLGAHGVIAVSGYEEAMEIYLDSDDVLVVQLGDRPLCLLPGAARG